MHDVLPEIPEGLGSPFYYSSLSSLLLLFAVPPRGVELGPSGHLFKLAELSETAVAAISFQRYLADYGTDTLVITELELSALVVPKSHPKEFSGISLEQFAKGEEQSLSVGFLPVAVACDAEPAVNAGIKLFGEPKFLARMSSQAPSTNVPGSGARWTVSYTRDTTAATTDFTLSCDLSAQRSTQVNAAIVTTYGCVAGNPVGSRWNIYQAGDLYFPIVVTDIVSLAVRDDDPVVSSFAASVGSGSLAAVREHRTRPVAARGRPYSL